MKFTERDFPRPVLSYYSDDYNKYRYQAVPTIEPRSNGLECTVAFMLGEPELRTMVVNGMAKFVIHCECPYTRHRTVVSTNKDSATFSLNLEDVVDRLEINCFVLATRDFDGFASTNFHSDFSNMSFSVHAGNILAVSEPHYFELEDQADRLRPVSSIFRVEKNLEKNAPPMVVENSDHKLRILLSPEVFALHEKLVGDFDASSVLHIGLAVPALIEAIEWARNDAASGDDSSDRNWYRLLKRRAMDFNLAIEDEQTPAVEIAHKLLDNPLYRCLLATSRYATEEE